MQERKQIVEKAIKEFTQKTIGVLIKSDIQVLFEILKEKLKKSDFTSFDRIYNIIMALELNEHKNCIFYKDKNISAKDYV
jgi:hypothetical protein